MAFSLRYNNVLVEDKGKGRLTDHILSNFFFGLQRTKSYMFTICCRNSLFLMDVKLPAIVIRHRPLANRFRLMSIAGPSTLLRLCLKLVSMTKKMREEGYAYQYPEGQSYLHIGPLGEGSQGTVSVIYGKDKKLYVRKAAQYKKSFYCDEEGWGPEVTNYREHPHINKLVAFQGHNPITTEDPSEAEKIHCTLIHDFKNGGDLYHFYDGWAQEGLKVPESLIWRFTHQILSALNFLHRQNKPAISHCDLFGPNVLVNWPAGRNARPNFYLADLGHSSDHDLEASPEEPARLVHDMDAAEGFAEDMRDFSSMIFYLMTGDSKDKRCVQYKNELICKENYSTDLVVVADALLEYAQEVEDDINADNNDIVELVRKKANARRPGENIHLETVRPSLKKLTPLVFDTLEELDQQIVRPPGPFHVVKIDMKTFKILETVSGPYRSDTVHYTTLSGVRMPIAEPASSECSDSMPY